MNRRGFLKALSTAAVGVAVAAHVPAQWMPTLRLRNETALEYLRRAYNEHTRGKGAAGHPREIHVGWQLFEAAESEMLVVTREVYGHTVLFTTRDAPGTTLRFKGSTLRAVGQGWDIKAIL